MKLKVFFRVGKKGNGTRVEDYLIRASLSPSSKTLGNKPTVAFAIVFDIPDERFKESEKVIGEVKLNQNATQVLWEGENETV